MDIQFGVSHATGATGAKKHDTLHSLTDAASAFNQTPYPERHSKYENLADNQHPKVAIVGCMDSRVHPHELLHYDPGQVFELRNAGNMVDYQADRSTAGSIPAGIQFAAFKGIEDVIVLGHSDCGAIKGLLSSALKLEHVKRWITQNNGIISDEQRLVLNRAAQRANEPEFIDRVSKENLKGQVRKLETFLEDAKIPNVKVQGWFFDIGDTTISRWDRHTKRFETIA